MFPEFAGRTCADCQKWLYDDDTGEIRTSQRSGEKLLRPPHMPPLCRRRGSRKCPKGTPETEEGFDDRSLAAYRFHKQCEAINQFPADPLVAQHAGVIRVAEEDCRRAKQDSAKELQLLLLQVAKGRRT